MTRLAAAAAVPAAADLFCRLIDSTCLTDCAETFVRFSIDASQFVAPQDPSDSAATASWALPWGPSLNAQADHGTAVLSVFIKTQAKPHVP
jgi:hypothetical protein